MGRNRVFVGGIGHESCGFTPLRTALDQFHVGRGAEWLRGAAQGGGVVGGALAVLTEADFVAVPGLSAWAGVSGLVEREAWRALCGELLDRLRAVPPVDGVLLDLHGSLTAEDVADAQGDLLQGVRGIVGPAVPVVCALDLHASVTPRMVGAVDAFVGYRTAPHRDHFATGRRAAALLRRMLDEGRRPAMAQVRVPLLLPGEFAQTDTDPTAALWRMAEGLEADPAVWCVSILDGFPWVDAPHNEASVVVVADAPERARLCAQTLAGAMWAVRVDFYRSVPAVPVEEGLRQARTWAAEGRPVVLSDTGDNPTAGAPQDRADMVAALRTAGLRPAVVALLADAPAVAAARAAGVGAEVDVVVGGTLAPGASPRVPLRAMVRALVLGTAAGTVAVLEDGGVRVVVGERRLGMTDPDFLRPLGIDPLTPGQTLVLKIGYLFPRYVDLLHAAPQARSLLLLTPGATSLDPRTFVYRRVSRPIYPLDRGFDGDGGAAPTWGVTVRAGSAPGPAA